jgi:hypothetical protein
MSGRITQLNISRWSDKGGSYRTVQRFFHTPIDWSEVHWLFFYQFLYDQDAVHIMVGDESPVGKAGKRTFGLDWLFSSVLDKVIPGLAFFSIALIDVKKRQAYTLSTEQVVRSEGEKGRARKRKALRKTRSQEPAAKRPRELTKASKNKVELTLCAELTRILAQVQREIGHYSSQIFQTRTLLPSSPLSKKLRALRV